LHCDSRGDVVIDLHMKEKSHEKETHPLMMSCYDVNTEL